MPVYFIGRGRKGPIKIGFSKNPQKRMKSLQTANAEPLHLMAVVKGRRKLEKLIQRDLSSYAMGGEWFQRAPRVEEFVERADEEVARVLAEEAERQAQRRDELAAVEMQAAMLDSFSEDEALRAAEEAEATAEAEAEARILAALASGDSLAFYTDMRLLVLGHLGKTQAEQAKALGVSQPSVGRIAGKAGRRSPGSQIERLLLCAFGEMGPRQRASAIKAGLKRLREVEPRKGSE